MIKKVYREYFTSNDRPIAAFVKLDNNITIMGEEINIGDEIAFIIDDTFYEGSVTGWEKPLWEDGRRDIEEIYIDEEKVNLIEMTWLGIK